jgi:rod shape-determining protein MreB
LIFNKIHPRYIALDLGTTSTLIHLEGQGVVVNEPSVIAVNEKGQIEALGREAKRMLGRTPPNIRAIRPMEDGVIADYETAELMLKALLRQALKGASIVKPRALCCVPSGITEVEKRAVRDSVKNAGVREIYLIEEPIAAAVGMRLPIEESTGSIVVDVGGGTTEVAVMSLGGVVVSESRKIGGNFMDQAVDRYLRSHYNIFVGEQICEEIKITIGSAVPLEEEETFEVKGRNMLNGIPTTVTISSTEVREALRESIVQVIGAVRSTLEQTPPELASDIVNAGINMTGGGSLLKRLDDANTQETNLRVHRAASPLTTIIEGLGMILDDFRRYRRLFNLYPT